METRQQRLYNLLLKDLQKLGYIKSTNLKYRDRIYYDIILVKNKNILIEVVNSHNDYRELSISQFQEVCKNLIDLGYQIDMCYPCYIKVSDKHFNDLISDEYNYYYGCKEIK